MLKSKIVATIFGIMLAVFYVGSLSALMDREIGKYEFMKIATPIIHQEDAYRGDRVEAPETASGGGAFQNIFKGMQTIKQYAGILKGYTLQMEDGLSHKAQTRYNLIGVSNLMTGILAQNSSPDTAEKEIYRADSGHLIASRDKADLKSAVSHLCVINSTLKSKGIPFLFVLAPNKDTRAKETFPFAMQDFSDIDSSELLKELDKQEIAYLDLRKPLRAKFTEDEIFYRTDHHWKTEIGFEAATIIGKVLNEEYGFSIDAAVFDKKNYEFTETKKSFLGTYGRRSGLACGGADDFTVITPKFATGIEKILTAENLKISGTFNEVLISSQRLKGQMGADRYNVYAGKYGHVTGFFTNKKNKTDEKILFVGDSFGYVIYPFLLLGVHELYYLNSENAESITKATDFMKPGVVCMLHYAGNMAAI